LFVNKDAEITAEKALVEKKVCFVNKDAEITAEKSLG